MREHLLGYLLGALDASQQREVEQALENDPQLRRELELLDGALEPLRADRGLHEPPVGLADRTLDAVAAVAGWPEDRSASDDPAEVDEEHEAFRAGFFGDANRTIDAGVDAEVVKPGAAGDDEPPAAGRRRGALAPVREFAGRSWADRWAILDVVASAGVVAAAAMLFFPAIANSRFQSKVVACDSNLKILGEGLANYSDNHNGHLVPIPVEGPLAISGVYGPTLRDGGYVTDERAFLCAGDARPQTTGEGARRIPGLAEFERAFGPELRRLQRLAGGSYGYSLGFMIDGSRPCFRNLRRPAFAILADAPGPQREGRNSQHHGGRGQNVLFEDGHTQFLAGSMAGPDEIFFSDRNLVEAGQHYDDAVIGDSHSAPIIFTGGGR
jgi:hypothetical protein